MVYRRLTALARFHADPLDLLPIQNRGHCILAWCVLQAVYTAVPHVSFCNTTGENLTCIIQAKWLSSCGIVSQLDQYHCARFQVSAPSGLASQAASNLSAVPILL